VPRTYSLCDVTFPPPHTAKSEASTLLAVKQAAFIRNPDYDGDGSGPDIVTVGHNPFVPNMGLAAHVVLNSVRSLSDSGHIAGTCCVNVADWSLNRSNMPATNLAVF
jgi:hypothetical protein